MFMVTTSYECLISVSHRHSVLRSSIKLNPGQSCGEYDDNFMLVWCLSSGLESFHVDPSPTDPFVQRDAFSRVAHGLLPGDQLWPLRLQAAGEHIIARCVGSRASRAPFLHVQISWGKLVAGASWGARHTLKWILHLEFQTAKRWLPAPEERHDIADDLVLFVHSQVSWLDCLWRRAQPAHLQPRMRRKAGTYKRPSARHPQSTREGIKCGDEGGGMEWMV